MSVLEMKAWDMIDSINDDITKSVKARMTGKRLTMMALKDEHVIVQPLGIRPPDMRLWVRGDGCRYKDPGYIKVTDSHMEHYGRKYSSFKTMFKGNKHAVLDHVWETLKNTKGAKDIGTVSGCFKSDKHSPALKVDGIMWVKRPWGIEFGSMSRLKAKNGVWIHTPPKEKVC